MSTPLYDALLQFSASAPSRYHMPGHHGHALPGGLFPGYAALDVTEVPPVGDLFSAGGPIEQAQQLWADVCQMAHCLFLTGGSTQGILSALTLACPPGSGILVDRGCHRSVYHAMALLDLHPVYLSRPWVEQAAVAGPISPQDVEKKMLEHPNIKTVCITSPTYYGVLSDLPAIAAVVHRHGGYLVVDGAHGAHLPFLGENPYRAADLAIVSAHKTLPAPGQTALLLSGGRFDMDALRRAGKIYGSSSPSFPMMAALDVCRDDMLKDGTQAYRRAVDAVTQLRQAIPSLSEGDGLVLDPARFVWNVVDGHAAKARLEARGIYPEMADAAHVVFIITCADSAQTLAQLAQVLREECAAAPAWKSAACPPLPTLPLAQCSPRTALFGQQERMVLSQAEGRISADQVAPYPPGIPVIAPGECIDKKHLSYLAQVGYNMNSTVGVLSQSAVKAGKKR